MFKIKSISNKRYDVSLFKETTSDNVKQYFVLIEKKNKEVAKSEVCVTLEQALQVFDFLYETIDLKYN